VVTPAIVGVQANGATVLPFIPSNSTSGSPISGTLGDLTIDSVSTPITEFDFEINNAPGPFTNEAFTAVVRDYNLNWRELSGSVSFRARRDMMHHIGRYRNATAATRNFQVTVGSVAGHRFVLSLPTAEVTGVGWDLVSPDETMIKLDFQPLGSSENEATLTFT
jgi:hypothetical protein